MNLSRISLQVASLGLCATLLNGCASLPPRAQPQAEPVEYSVSGRMSVRYVNATSSQREQLYGGFEWVEHGNAIALTLTDPLGQGVARIESNPQRTSIMLRDGSTRSAPTPEALTRATLGWTLPLSGLRNWLRGHGGKGARTETNAAGRIRSVQEDGWLVRYPQIDSDPVGHISRIDLDYSGPGPEISLRLLPDEP